MADIYATHHFVGSELVCQPTSAKQQYFATVAEQHRPVGEKKQRALYVGGQSEYANRQTQKGKRGAEITDRG